MCAAERLQGPGECQNGCASITPSATERGVTQKGAPLAACPWNPPFQGGGGSGKGAPSPPPPPGQRSSPLPPIRCQTRRPPLPGNLCDGMLHHSACRDCRPFVHEKVRKSTKKCESQENRELRIGTKMYENVRIVGLMDMTIFRATAMAMFCKGAFSHSARTAPVITVSTPVIALKTCHL